MATTAPATKASPASATSYSMSSLYIGDLHPEVNESMLFEKFSVAGPVLSIRVCRDNASRLSLGYAYINFQQPADAERALDTMNFDELNGRPMRLMWSQRDPAARRSGSGNIFIKNLDKVIDNKSIYDTFSLFGNILSCKVAQDEHGVSRGYGFVHFETEEAAQTAITKVNGMLLAGKKVFVGKFQPRAQRQRELGDTPESFTNVFVKNFGEDINQEGLEKLFSKFGEIESSAIMAGPDGKSKGFGFVSFKAPESAEKAVAEMHDVCLDGSDKKLTVCRAQKKAERQTELKKKYAQVKAERIQQYQGVNLFVKNLDDSVDEEMLRKTFEPFGTLASVKIMTDDNNRSKGFGFVCFENSDEANKAVAELNSKMIYNKPLYVAVAQRKEDRRAQLASQYMQRLAGMRVQNSGMPGNTMYTPGQGGYFVTNTMQRGFVPPGVGGPGMRMQQQQRGGWPMPTPPQYATQQPFMVQGGGMPPMMQRGGARPTMSSINTQQPLPFAHATQLSRKPMPGQQQPIKPAGVRTLPSRSASTGAKPGAPVMYQTPQYNTQQPHVQNQPARPTQGIVIGGQEPLTIQMLASAAPHEQKQLLGERIYGLIDKLYPGMKDAGKITGMMLEIDNAELLMMLQDTDLLRSKVAEAGAVLNQSTARA